MDINIEQIYNEVIERNKKLIELNKDRPNNVKYFKDCNKKATDMYIKYINSIKE